MIKTTVLPNGLKVVTENKKFNTVSMGIYVNVGSLNETEELSGISHVLEHMAFKGTKTKNAQQLSDQIESLGGNCNAYTTTDHTAYVVNILPDYWKIGIDFLSDIIQNSTFPEEELEKERKVILQEIDMYKDDLNATSWLKLYESVYPNQALGRPVIGTKENVTKFTRDDLLDYVKKGYTTDKMVISMVGNVKHEEVVDYVKNTFTSLPNKNQLPVAQSKYEYHDITVESKFAQTAVIVSMEGDPLYHKNTYVSSLFRNILDGGMSCRLFQEVREKRGLVYSVGVVNFSEIDTGLFGVWAAINKENIDETITVIKDTLNTMLTDITEEELEKAKNIILHSQAAKQDKVESIANQNAIITLHGKKIRSFNSIKKKINSIKLEDVYKYAKHLLNNKYSITIVHSK